MTKIQHFILIPYNLKITILYIIKSLRTIRPFPMYPISSYPVLHNSLS
nr:MAG TPA: hypothetical protein [Caudoviricetes sp.]